ncbi:MAG: hypothetical protein PVF58_11650 [Candidatus Methanofastidiosia archaeon]|jgi:hypothetical protein
MEFWNDQATDKSWNALIELSKKYEFILIGGWACYLHTGTIKSQVVDIIVEFETLNKLKKEFLVKKNDILKKYEIIFNEISVDIYVPYYSEFIIPFECIIKNTMKIQGITVPNPEIILILKQQAELERKNSVKGQKDRVDILNLLIESTIDMKKYLLLVKEYDLMEYMKRLETIIQTSQNEFEYLGMENLRRIKLLKKKLMKTLTSAKLEVF